MYRDRSVVEERIADVAKQQAKVTVLPIAPVPECPEDVKASPPARPDVDDKETTAIVSPLNDEDPVCTAASVDGSLDLAFLKPFEHAATTR